eukprot:7110388-Ditylum_brightwellii.AAC.1
MVSWKPTGVCKENHQILNLGDEGGSATDITRRFDYTLGLASQLKVSVSYSEVALPGLKP